MNAIIKNIILFSFLSSITSCKKKEENNAKIDQKTKEIKSIIDTKPPKSSTLNYISKTKELAIDFNNRLKNKQSLSSLMDKNWTLIYDEENRCDGLTNGEKKSLLNIQIDTIIALNVRNNSEDAWACEKKEPYNYILKFDLKKQIENWDRFEIENDNSSNTTNKEEDIFYIHGAGESDYIRIYFGNNKLIKELKYSSEDPG